MPTILVDVECADCGATLQATVRSVPGAQDGLALRVTPCSRCAASRYDAGAEDYRERAEYLEERATVLEIALKRDYRDVAMVLAARLRDAVGDKDKSAIDYMIEATNEVTHDSSTRNCRTDISNADDI